MAVKYLSSINLNRNELQLARIQNLATEPSTTGSDKGLLYYDTGSNTLFMFNGTQWLDVSGDIKSIISNTTDQLTVGSENGPNVQLNIVTGDVGASSASLATGAQIYSYLFGDSQRITVEGTTNEVTVVTNNTNNDKLQLGNTLTVGLPDDVTITNDLTVGGDLVVNGTTTTVNSTVVTIDDPVFTLGGDTAPSADDNKDRGIEFRYHDGTNARLGFFGFDDSKQRFSFFTAASNSSEVFSGTDGSIDIADLRLSGSIKSVNGNAPADGQVLIGSTAGADMSLAELTAGEGIDITNGSGTITIDAETATDSNPGIVELATTAEALTGTDETRAVTPAGLAARSFTATIGDGNTEAITVTHSLGTKDVIVQIYEISTGDTVITDIQRNNTNSILLNFATAPTSNAIKVLVMKID